jgi:hypothetical protein
MRPDGSIQAQLQYLLLIWAYVGSVRNHRFDPVFLERGKELPEGRSRPFDSQIRIAHPTTLNDFGREVC